MTLFLPLSTARRDKKMAAAAAAVTLPTTATTTMPTTTTTKTPLLSMEEAVKQVAEVGNFSPKLADILTFLLAETRNIRQEL